jgi:ABC-type antimicrobial peptide transport system permease subunit
VTLLIVAVISSGLPALRASRVDPNIALRSD